MGGMRHHHQKRKEKKKEKLLMKNFVSFTATGVCEGGSGVGAKEAVNPQLFPPAQQSRFGSRLSVYIPRQTLKASERLNESKKVFFAAAAAVEDREEGREMRKGNFMSRNIFM